MDILIFIFGLPIVAFILLASMQGGAPFLSMLGIVGVLCLLAAAAIFPIGPSSGPDDWFHGIEVVPLFGTLGAALAASIAQAIRWLRLRQGKKPHYIVILIGVLFSAFVITTSLGSL
jgi:hypothetical protein